MTIQFKPFKSLKLQCGCIHFLHSCFQISLKLIHNYFSNIEKVHLQAIMEAVCVHCIVGIIYCSYNIMYIKDTWTCINVMYGVCDFVNKYVWNIPRSV